MNKQQVRERMGWNMRVGKHQIEKRSVRQGGVWTHHVKDNGYIVFRGTEEQCKHFAEAAHQHDLERDAAIAKAEGGVE